MATRGPEPVVTKDELLDAIERHDNPFVTSKDMSSVLGVERQTAWKHLQQLHEDTQLEKKKIGSSAVIWWVPKNN